MGGPVSFATSTSVTSHERVAATRRVEIGRPSGPAAAVPIKATVVYDGSSGRGLANRPDVLSRAGITGPTVSHLTAKVASYFRTAFAASLPAILASSLAVNSMAITSRLTVVPESQKGPATSGGLDGHCISGPSSALVGRVARLVVRPKISGLAVAIAVTRRPCLAMVRGTARGVALRSTRFRSMPMGTVFNGICRVGSPCAVGRAVHAIIQRGRGPTYAICDSPSTALVSGCRLIGCLGSAILAQAVGLSNVAFDGVRPSDEMGCMDLAATGSSGSGLCNNWAVGEGLPVTKVQHFKIWSAAHLAAMRDYRICILL